MKNNEISTMVEAIYKHCGERQGRAADYIGVDDQQTVSRWMRGSSPNPENELKIRSAYARLLKEKTELRPEEAVLMRWSQVDLQAGSISLPKTKTIQRRVPISPEAVAILRGLHGAAADNALIFSTEENARREKPVRHYRRAFEQACIRAGINRPARRDVGRKAANEAEDQPNQQRVTLYTLRHSAATYLLMHGADIRTVADILGHENISMTMKYTHMVDSHKMAAVSNPALPWKR